MEFGTARIYARIFRSKNQANEKKDDGASGAERWIMMPDANQPIENMGCFTVRSDFVITSLTRINFSSDVMHLKFRKYHRRNEKNMAEMPRNPFNLSRAKLSPISVNSNIVIYFSTFIFAFYIQRNISILMFKYCFSQKIMFRREINADCIIII